LGIPLLQPLTPDCQSSGKARPVHGRALFLPVTAAKLTA
jgi:hypothetical protein